MEPEDDTLTRRKTQSDKAEPPSGGRTTPARRSPAERRPPAERTSAPEGTAEDWGSPRIVHKPIPIESLDRDAVSIIRRLTRKGHTAYLVGGCVRDLLLGVEPKDFDIATSARPRQVKRTFRNCRVIGRRFRLAHVIFGSKIIEVSTFRQCTDSEKSDDPDDHLIRDDNVFGTPEADARRRDLTINGLFYDLQQGTVIDYVGGLRDIERKTLRMIGDPDIRFQEDPIRILRAIKFAARLGVHISPKTMHYIEAHRGIIARSAPPRILEEILRMSRGVASRKSFDLMLDTRVLEVVLPDVWAGIEKNPTRCDLYRSEFDVLDEAIREGLEPTAPIVFGVYLLPIVFPEEFFEDDALTTRPDGLTTESKIESVLADLIPRLRLSRRDAGRLRQVLMAQRRLAPSTRKRRFSRSSLARQAYFPEALDLFRIHGRAFGKWSEEAERWQTALDAHAATSGGDGAKGDGRGGDEGGDKPKAPRRRRRRRRRSKRSTGGDDAS